MLINVPDSNLVVDIDFHQWEPYINRRLPTSNITLESRLDSNDKIFIRTLVPDKLPEDLTRCFQADADQLTKVIGPLHSVIKEGNKYYERILLSGEQSGCARIIWRSQKDAWMISATGEIGKLHHIAKTIDLIYRSRTNTKPVNISESPIKIYGGFIRDRETRVGMIVDILIGPAQLDCHVKSLVFKLKGCGEEEFKNFQGRQLKLFSRSLGSGGTIWNTCSIPAGWHHVIQLPIIPVSPNINQTKSDLVIKASGGNGEEITLHSDLDALHLPMEIAHPLSGEWIPINTPDLLSIHRFATRIIDNQLKAPQRGAIDFIINHPATDEEAPPTSNAPSSHSAFGQPVFAPCGGTVICATNDLNDNLIGARDTANPRGNQVVIKKQEGLFIVMAHLKKGSVNVMSGDKVIEGQKIGAIGNSGNSSEPHLHIHAADSPNRIDANGFIVSIVPQNSPLLKSD